MMIVRRVHEKHQAETVILGDTLVKCGQSASMYQGQMNKLGLAGFRKRAMIRSEEDEGPCH